MKRTFKYKSDLITSIEKLIDKNRILEAKVEFYETLHIKDHVKVKTEHV